MRAAVDIEVPLEPLLEGIFHRYHYDFRRYERTSMRRRLAAAMAALQCATVPELTGRVLDEPLSFAELLRYLTVQVSDLFRDPGYFRAVREKVVPYLQTYPSLKVWVAGCATGEEAYSLAIIFAEEGLLERTLIYATDIHSESLRTAEAGIYDASRFALFSKNYLEAGGRRSLADYYTASTEAAVLDRSLKRAILFTDHSLATDHVFAEVELVSCRNVLIYFDEQLQNRALDVLAGSLCRKGCLGLGSNETLYFSPQAHRFTELAPHHRIYQRL